MWLVAFAAGPATEFTTQSYRITSIRFVAVSRTRCVLITRADEVIE
jgi:hypothetical protein